MIIFFSVPNVWTKIAIFFGSNNNNNNLIPFWDDTEVFFLIGLTFFNSNQKIISINAIFFDSWFVVEVMGYSSSDDSSSEGDSFYPEESAPIVPPVKNWDKFR